MSPKQRSYEALLADIDQVLESELDPIVWMATLSALIRQHLGYFWVGFYRVVGGELLIGPYQGTLGCVRITFDRGVCGACARKRETIVVPDVHQFPGHIACDSRSRSEIVVPIFDQDNRLRAVMDIDSTELNSFDQVDQESLEAISQRMRELAWTDQR